MIATEINFKGIKVFEPDVFTDDRGYFTESFREEWLSEIRFIQENESFSKKNVLRGLHYQKSPFAQTKLVRCIMGEILDVVVDLRESSSTFGQHFKIKLSGQNKKQLFIPQGFAHGFLTLSDWALVSYKVDNYYNKDLDRTIRFDDKIINIEWGVDAKDVILSDKDRAGINFLNAPYF